MNNDNASMDNEKSIRHNFIKTQNLSHNNKYFSAYAIISIYDDFLFSIQFIWY